MDTAVDIARSCVSKHHIQPEYREWAGLCGTGRPNLSRETKFSSASRDNGFFPCSADHEQDWQPYPVDLYTLLYVMTIHT